MRTKAYRKKLMTDLKSATKNCLESVEKPQSTENKKKFVGQCQYIILRNAISASPVYK